MINKKNLFTVGIFLIITFLVLFQTFSVKKFENSKEVFINQENIEKTLFKNISYFSIRDGVNISKLKSKDLEIITFNGNRTMTFSLANGRENIQDRWVDWKADDAIYTSQNRDLKLTGNVFFKNDQSSYKTQNLYYSFQKHFLEAKEGVSSKIIDLKTSDILLVDSNYMSSWTKEKRVLFIGNVNGKLKRKLKYQSGMNFSSERMEYQQHNAELNLDKNVKIDRNNYHLESQRADIYLENYNKKLKYYVLYDDIELEETMSLAQGEKKVRKAFSEKLEGFISESKTVLTGAPRVEQGDDVIKGYQITLRENVEIVEVDDAQSSFKLKRKN